MKRVIFLVVMILTPFLNSCGDSGSESKEKQCDTSCESWQTCVNGACQTKAGYCNGTTALCEDPNKPHCDLGTNTCSTVTTDCENPCGEWQYCYYGTCYTRPNRCLNHDNCTTVSKPVCDPESHFCVAQTSPCNPACQDWEKCNTATFTCELAPGNCNENSDCTVSGLPICDLTTHECKGETTDCESSCGDWGYCYNGYCNVKQDGLHCGEGVPCPSIHLPHCNEITHQCEVAPEDNCDGSCQYWETCQEGKCVTASAYCGNDRPCKNPQRPICNSETHLCESQVQNTYLEPTQMDHFPGLIVTTESMKSSFQRSYRDYK